MRYDKFRDLFERALRDAGLFPPEGFRTETIDAGTMERRFEIVAGHELPQRAEPFHVTCTLGFRWDPFQSARSFTAEEDLVTELYGRDEMLPGTMRRSVRVDLRLSAGFPHGSEIRMPDAAVWRRWAPGDDAKLATSLPHIVEEGEGGRREVKAWRGDVEVRGRVSSDSAVFLDGLALPAFQFVNPPRAWDNPDRSDEGLPDQLADLANRARAAFTEWMDCVAELRVELGLPWVH